MDDAVTILDLMTIMLASVYQEPAKIRRVQESRLARAVQASAESEIAGGATPEQ